MTTTTAGDTPLYMAPELLNPGKFGKTNSRPTQPADIYALEMVIYKVLTGFLPIPRTVRDVSACISCGRWSTTDQTRQRRGDLVRERDLGVGEGMLERKISEETNG